MNRNLIIGVIVVLIIAAGGYYFLVVNPSAVGINSTANSTVVATTDNAGSTTATPAAPTVATNANVEPSNSTAVVTGTVTPNGAQTTYWYEYGPSTSLGSKTAAQSIGSGWSAIPSPAYITGLQANTAYYYRLSASNAYGTIDGPTYGFSTNNNPPGQGTPPAASTNSASSIGRTSATVNAQINPHSSATTFWFEYGASTDFGSVTAFQSAGSADVSAAVAAQLSGLSPQTKYYFRINAQNQYGTVNGATQSFTTSGPAVSTTAPVVTTQVASPVATTTATLRGTVNPSGAQTTYWFEYSTDSLLGSVLLKTTPQQSAGAAQSTDSVQANLSSLQPNTTYYYRTVAQNAAGTVRGDNQTFTTN